MFSLKRANKNLQKRARRASEVLYDFVGLSPRKELLRALLAGDEEKAIKIYVLVTNGKSLEEDMYPSLPFLENNHETPMHLAALKGMDTLLQMFFRRGGNPNILNMNNETCLHAVCREPGQDNRKRGLLLAVLQWEGHSIQGETEDEDGVVACSVSEEGERVSVNMVDSDGNTACHYAAASGLERCVEMLVRRGAIISIVNKDQMTCCELADEGQHVQLANSLELALVFQPPDRSTLFLSEGGDFQHEADQPLFLPDAASFTSSSLWVWRQLQVVLAREALVTHSIPQIEAMLDRFDWNINELVFRYMSDSSATLKAANLKEEDDERVGRGARPKISNCTSSDANALLKEGNKHGHEEGAQQEQQVEKEETNECSICAETMYPPLSPQQLMAMTSGEDQEDLNRDQRQIDCGGGHSFCLSCWSTHLKMRVVENSCSALSCPAFKCGEALDHTAGWAECLLGATIAKRLHENICRRCVDSSVDFCWCPAKDCDLVIHVEEEARSSSSSSSSAPTLAPQVTVTCGNGHSICLACKDVGHAPCSCEDFAQWKTKIAKEIDDNAASLNTNDIATALWVQANTKKCPKCKTPIEKDEGCNHMTCKKCRYDFCWICMQRWENHSNRTGGYFQCNMFMAGGEEDEGDKEDMLGDDSLFSDVYSGGSSSKETIRLRKNAAMMDRFIQHYSSFKAQQESVQLEVRMQFDTLERITEGLQRSAGEQAELWLRGEDVPHPLCMQHAEDCQADNRMEGVEHENDYCRRGDVETLVSSSSYPILFLQRGFRELIKCRQFLKGFFPFSYYMLSEDHARPGSRGSYHHRPPGTHHMLVESRKDAIDRARADLETLTETLSNIVARKRLRASRSEIERATRAARSTRLEFEFIISEFLKVSESNMQLGGNKRGKHASSSHQKTKNKNRWGDSNSGTNSDNSSRRRGYETGATESLSLGELSIFENIEFLKALAGGDRNNRSPGGGRERGQKNSSGTPSARKRSSTHRSRTHRQRATDTNTENDNDNDSDNNENVLDIGGIDHNPSERNMYNEDEEAALAGGGGGKSRSSSVSSSSSSSSVNIRQVGSDGLSYTLQTKSPSPSKKGGRTGREEREHRSRSGDEQQSLSNIFPRSGGGGSEGDENENEDEAVEMNRAILLSLQQQPPPPPQRNMGQSPEPSETDIQALLVMGFEREMSAAALRDSSNNVEDAIMLLLSRA